MAFCNVLPSHSQHIAASCPTHQPSGCSVPLFALTWLTKVGFYLETLPRGHFLTLPLGPDQHSPPHPVVAYTSSRSSLCFDRMTAE